MTGAPTTSPGSTGSGSNLSPSCGEGGPTVSPLSGGRTGSGMTDPMTGQLLDSSSLAALSSYPRLGGGMSALGTGMYGTSYPSTEQNPYPSISMENSAFYGSLVSKHKNKGSRFFNLCLSDFLNQVFRDFLQRGFNRFCSLNFLNITTNIVNPSS